MSEVSVALTSTHTSPGAGNPDASDTLVSESQALAMLSDSTKSEGEAGVLVRPYSGGRQGVVTRSAAAQQRLARTSVASTTTHTTHHTRTTNFPPPSLYTELIYLSYIM